MNHPDWCGLLTLEHEGRHFALLDPWRGTSSYWIRLEDPRVDPEAVSFAVFGRIVPARRASIEHWPAERVRSELAGAVTVDQAIPTDRAFLYWWAKRTRGERFARANDEASD